MSLFEVLPKMEDSLNQAEERLERHIDESIFLAGNTESVHWTNPSSWGQESLIGEKNLERGESQRFSKTGSTLTHFGQRFAKLFDVAVTNSYRLALALVVSCVVYKASTEGRNGSDRVFNSLKTFISTHG